MCIKDFEPVTGSRNKKTEQQDKLAKAIKDRIPSEKLAQIREELANRLVAITVQFNLWKGPPDITNTRWTKDLDNLQKLLLDILKPGPHSLGLVGEDSFICEIHATKKLVERKEDEGYKIIMKECEDQVMLSALREARRDPVQHLP